MEGVFVILSRAVPEYIVWMDASFPPDTHWREIGDMEDLDLCKVYSVGFVVKETDSMITVAGHMVEGDDGAACGGFGEIAIPKTWILKRIKLSGPTVEKEGAVSWSRRGVEL